MRIHEPTDVAPPRSDFVLRKGSILCYRMFDVADEIDLEHARRLISAQTKRLKLGREGSQYLELPEPPLTLELGTRALALRDGSSLEIQASLRLFNFGAASIVLRAPIIPGTPMAALTPRADELYDSQQVDALCLELCQGVLKTVGPALQDAHLWEQFESYTIVFVEAIDGAPTAEQLLKEAPLAKLLLGEVQAPRLSERERKEVTQHAFSYTENDLAVVDWNAAFVYEPSGSGDVADILEIVNAQLLELRWFDAQLDQELKVTYDEIGQRRRKWWRFLRSPYRQLARRVMATVVEMTEFVERVENSLKIVGDFYLAKIYEASLKRLRINAWQASVQRKQQLLSHVYELLKGEVDTDRALTLEAMIVVLIVVELAIAAIQAIF